MVVVDLAREEGVAEEGLALEEALVEGLLGVVEREAGRVD